MRDRRPGNGALLVLAEVARDLGRAQQRVDLVAFGEGFVEAETQFRRIAKLNAASDLAAQVTMSASGLSRAIDRLVATGSIERVACDYDRRVVHARLTEQGRAELDEMLPDHLRVLEESFSVLTEAERRQFEALLRKLRCQVNPEAVQASDAPASRVAAAS